jgi:hypothetical protein
VNNEGPARQTGVCNNGREDGRPDGCLVDPVTHDCLGEDAVLLGEPGKGLCYDPRGLATWLERNRTDPGTRKTVLAADEAAVRQLAGLPPRHLPAAQEELDIEMMDAARQGRDAEVARLLAAGANVHAGNDYALRYASENGHAAVVARLLAAGADVHANNDLALRWASENGHDVVVARLLAAGANVHALYDDALFQASMNGHDAVVALLLLVRLYLNELKRPILTNSSSKHHLYARFVH